MIQYHHEAMLILEVAGDSWDRPIDTMSEMTPFDDTEIEELMNVSWPDASSDSSERRGTNSPDVQALQHRSSPESNERPQLKSPPTTRAIEQEGEDERDFLASFARYKRKRDDRDVLNTSVWREAITSRDQKIQKLEANLQESGQANEKKVEDLEAKMADSGKASERKIKELERKVVDVENKLAKVEKEKQELGTFADGVKRLTSALPNSSASDAIVTRQSGALHPGQRATRAPTSESRFNLGPRMFSGTRRPRAAGAAKGDTPDSAFPAWAVESTD